MLRYASILGSNGSVLDATKPKQFGDLQWTLQDKSRRIAQSLGELVEQIATQIEVQIEPHNVD